MLNKIKLEMDLTKGLTDLLTEQSNQATSGDENEDPAVVIKRMAENMAKVISSAVEGYILGGDIQITPANIMVVSTAFGSPSVVSPLAPAKIT